MTTTAAPGATPPRTPPPRATPRQRFREPTQAQRIASWLATSVWLLTGILVLAGIAALLFLHRGDAEGGARTANREIELLLERGETVTQRVPVLQRHWWDFFRVTHGVIAATDRRLLFVGVPPEELLAREPEPQELAEAVFPYGAVDVRSMRVFVGTLPGVRVSLGEASETFGFASRDRGRMDRVVAIVQQRQERLRLAAEAERRAAEAASAASRRAIYHLVQRGDALGSIAQRYGVPVDSLIAWNGLTTDRITAGRRLLVKPER